MGKRGSDPAVIGRRVSGQRVHGRTGLYIESGKLFAIQHRGRGRCNRQRVEDGNRVCAGALVLTRNLCENHSPVPRARARATQGWGQSFPAAGRPRKPL